MGCLPVRWPHKTKWYGRTSQTVDLRQSEAGKLESLSPNWSETPLRTGSPNE